MTPAALNGDLHPRIEKQADKNGQRGSWPPLMATHQQYNGFKGSASAISSWWPFNKETVFLKKYHSPARLLFKPQQLPHLVKEPLYQP